MPRWQAGSRCSRPPPSPPCRLPQILRHQLQGLHRRRLHSHRPAVGQWAVAPRAAAAGTLAALAAGWEPVPRSASLSCRPMHALLELLDTALLFPHSSKSADSRASIPANNVRPVSTFFSDLHTRTLALPPSAATPRERVHSRLLCQPKHTAFTHHRFRCQPIAATRHPAAMLSSHRSVRSAGLGWWHSGSQAVIGTCRVAAMRAAVVAAVCEQAQLW